MENRAGRVMTYKCFEVGRCGQHVAMKERLLVVDVKAVLCCLPRGGHQVHVLTRD